MILAVPNISEGRDQATIAAVAGAFGAVLDVHSDADHHRSVISLRYDQDRVVAGVREAIARIDLTHHSGVHPRVGAVDVAPVVYLDPADRGVAIAEALVLADRLGHELRLPVHLYGELGRPRAEVRKNPGAPDFGPPSHPTAGRTLVTARPPLIAFNVEVDTTLEHATAIAAAIRSTAVKAIAVPLTGAVQVSTNIEDWTQTSPAQVVAAVAAHAPVTRAELVGLAPGGAFADFPHEIPMPGFDAERQLLRPYT